jgi:hypothetical protein
MRRGVLISFVFPLMMAACTEPGGGAVDDAPGPLAQSSQRAPVSAAAAWQEVVDEEAGFRMTLPLTWRRVALDDYPQVETVLTSKPLMLMDPRGQTKLLVPGNGGRLLAVDAADTASVAVRTVVGTGSTDVSQVPGPSIDEPVRRNVPGMTYERSVLGGRTAIKVTFAREGIRETRFYLVENGREFQFTLSGTSPELASIVESVGFT